MTMLGAGLIILAIAFAAIGFLWVLPAWREYRGKKTVTCPETGQSATVEVDAARVATSAWRGVPDVRLKHCSRWPERATCGQDCLIQVEG